MKRFRFSLATVLKVKRQVEELRQRELAQARSLRDQAIQELARLRSSVREGAEVQGERRRGRINLTEERWYNDRLTALRNGITRTLATLAEREALVEEARLKAVEAARERAALEKLEEGQYQEHLLALNREEQAFLDELAQRSERAMSMAGS